MATPYLLRVGLIMLAALIAPTALAQSYKCLDRGGKAFYSDRPCKERGMTEQKVLKDAPPAPPPHAHSNKRSDDAQRAAPDAPVKRDARGNPES